MNSEKTDTVTVWTCDCDWCDEPSHRVEYVPASRVAELEEAFDTTGGDWITTAKRVAELEAALADARRIETNSSKPTETTGDTDGT